MKPHKHMDEAMILDHRYSRLAKAVGSPITLDYKGKIYRAHYTMIGQLIVVSCGTVTTTLEHSNGRVERKAREMLFELVQSGMLEHGASRS